MVLLGDRDVRGPVQQPVERDPTLSPRQWRTGAGMDAVSESNVRPGVRSLQVELSRVREGARITVARTRRKHHRPTCGDLDTAERGGDTGHPELGPKWALEPKRLLDEVR